MKKFAYILPVLFLTQLSLSGQDCTGYQQYHCTYADYSFFYSRQSKSFLMKPGQSAELKVIAYSGEDYYIAVCAHSKFGNINFRILEDNAERTVIYDNKDDKYAESIIFSNEVTRNLIIEVNVPFNEKSENERRCVGTIIEFRKSS
jgi:hypothetical protein